MSLKDNVLKDNQIRLRGKIMLVSPVQLVGEKQTPKQDIIVNQPAIPDGYGGFIGDETAWQFTLMGANVAKFNLDHDRNSLNKVIVIAWVNSNQVKSKTAGNPDMYIVNLTLNDLEIVP